LRRRRPPAREAELAGQEKSAAEQMSRLHPGPQFAGALAVQEGSAKRTWGSGPERMLHFSPPTAASGGEGGSSGEGGEETELGAGVGEEWSGCRQSEMVVAVGK
jgi:hypothetical protein